MTHMAVPIGRQGQAGTRAYGLRGLIAAAMALVPVTVSTMNGIGFFTLSFISERMYPGRITETSMARPARRAVRPRIPARGGQRRPSSRHTP